jgi:hypothetical protein
MPAWATQTLDHGIARSRRVQNWCCSDWGDHPGVQHADNPATTASSTTPAVPELLSTMHLTARARPCVCLCPLFARAACERGQSTCPLDRPRQATTGRVGQVRLSTRNGLQRRRPIMGGPGQRECARCRPLCCHAAIWSPVEGMDMILILMLILVMG